jgi:hypothetical protein
MDAALMAPQSRLVRHSLTAAFRRQWPSTCDALADGFIDVTAVRMLFAGTLSERDGPRSPAVAHRWHNMLCTWNFALGEKTAPGVPWLRPS